MRAPRTAVLTTATAIAVAALGACGSNNSSRAGAATRDLRVQLAASDGGANDYFGGALWYNTFVTPVKPVYYGIPGEVATNSAGTRAVIGAPGHAVGGLLGAGNAYVYRSADNAWKQVASLTANAPAAYDGFGWSVAMSGDGSTLAVSAPYRTVQNNERQGVVDVFRASGNGWTLAAELTQSDAHTDDNFGWSVAFARNGNSLIVGAPGFRVLDNPDRSGAAFVYARHGNGWPMVRQLIPPNVVIGAAFGTSTALSANGETALVASADSVDAQKVHHRGSIDVYTSGDTWRHFKHRAGFTDPNVNADGTSDGFGVSASLSDGGRIAAIAAPGVNVNGVQAAGAVYVFQSASSAWTTSTTTAQLTAPSPSQFDGYGSAVALSGNGASLVVGVDGSGTNDQGIVYRATAQSSFLPHWRSGVEQQLVPAPDTEPGRFGTAVAANENASIVVVSAPWRAVGDQSRQGVAYVVSSRGWG
jgi:hypothetical protein